MIKAKSAAQGMVAGDYDIKQTGKRCLIGEFICFCKSISSQLVKMAPYVMFSKYPMYYDVTVELVLKGDRSKCSPP